MVKKTSNQFRPPIVTLMGHIDHGKTTLLDKIRSSQLWKKETGGITQHIAAYQVKLKDHPTPITFIDTPGHAAFVNMRQTGSQITDLIVLVVSATEGLKAQTKECLKLIDKLSLPFIVAINKIDLPNASADKVKGQLVELGLSPEDYGGQISCLPLSAKTGQGIDKLLETIILNAEVMELKSQPQAPLEAFVVESKLDARRGPVASLIVKKGTLCLGDTVYLQDQAVKIKSIIDPFGVYVKKILPGFSAEVLGFDSPPGVASLITATPVFSAKTEIPAEGKCLEKSLAIILKADTQGTLDALLKSFSDDVFVVHSGIGPISENDVFLASSSCTQIFAFNLKTDKFIEKLAKSQGVRLFQSKIIYEIIDDINHQVLKILEPTIDETTVGEGKIIAEFNINKQRIAGVKTLSGELAKGATIHLKRDDKIIKDSKIDSIKQGKSDVDKVKTGTECGLTFKPYIDFKLNDVIISYYKTEEEQK